MSGVVPLDRKYRSLIYSYDKLNIVFNNICHISMVTEILSRFLLTQGATSCTDPESFVKGGPTF